MGHDPAPPCTRRDALHAQQAQVEALWQVARQKVRARQLQVLQHTARKLPRDRVLARFHDGKRVCDLTLGDVLADTYPEATNLWLAFAATAGGVTVLHALRDVPDLSTPASSAEATLLATLGGIALGTAGRDKVDVAREILDVTTSGGAGGH